MCEQRGSLLFITSGAAPYGVVRTAPEGGTCAYAYPLVPGRSCEEGEHARRQRRRSHNKIYIRSVDVGTR